MAIDLHTFATTMTPTTLAGLIADVQTLGTGVTPTQLKLEKWATGLLVANVGETEAEQLIQAAVDGVYAA